MNCVSKQLLLEIQMPKEHIKSVTNYVRVYITYYVANVFLHTYIHTLYIAYSTIAQYFRNFYNYMVITKILFTIFLSSDALILGI